jgi:hypothetical protein
MNGKNVMFIVLGFVLSILLSLMQKAQETPVIENWWGAGNPSFKWKAMPVTQQPGKAPQTMLGNAFIGNLPDTRFVKTTNMTSLISPRFDNSGQTSTIRYSPPSVANQACDSNNPLSSAEMVSENYSPQCGAGGSSGARMGPYGTTVPGFTAGDYQETLQNAAANHTYSTSTDIIPLGTMSQITEDGNMVNPTVYSQFIAASAKSKLRSHGDMIRGDLPIIPTVGQWFNVAVNPHLDLTQGAMNVMAGNDNSTARATANLIAASAGTANIPIAGVANAFAPDNTFANPQYGNSYSALGSDVNVQSGYGANLSNVRVSNMA